VLARRLIRERHQVVTADNGASALELAASQEFASISSRAE
jgi:hypothetical protein